MGSWFSSSIDFEKDFNDAIDSINIKIDKSKLSKDTKIFFDILYNAIDDKYPKKKLNLISIK